MVWGMLYHVTRGAYTPIRLINATLGAASCVLAFYIGVMVFSPLAGFFGALSACLYPPLIWHSINLMTEPFFIFFLTLTLFLLVVSQRNQSVVLAGAAGLATALGTLSRSVLQGFVPIAALWLFLVFSDRKKRFAASICYMVLFCCALAPWVIRNYHVFGKFVPTTTDSGHGFFIGNNARALTDPRGIWMPERWDFLKGLSETEIDKTLRNKGLQYVTHHPVMWARLALDKFCRFWRPIPHAQFIGAKPALVAGVSYCIAALLILPGVWIAGRKWRERFPWLLLVGLLAGYMTGIHMIFIAVTRYRAPLMPALLLFGGLTISTLIEHSRGQSACGTATESP